MDIAWNTPRDAGLNPDRLARLAGTLQDQIDRRRLPGAVAMIGRRGRVAWTHVAGELAPGSGVPMREDALFRIFSMTPFGNEPDFIPQFMTLHAERTAWHYC